MVLSQFLADQTVRVLLVTEHKLNHTPINQNIGRDNKTDYSRSKSLNGFRGYVMRPIV